MPLRFPHGVLADACYRTPPRNSGPATHLMTAGPEIQSKRSASRPAQFAWCLFDWANQGYPTVIETFIFATFFTQAVAVSPTEGTALWGYTLSVAGFLIVILSPILGAISDEGGRRKPWLLFFSLCCVSACALLWFTRPDPSWVVWALIFFCISATTFEFTQIFYNAMLSDLVPMHRIGRLSGFGWAAGYTGGLTVLTLILLLFVQPETPWLGLDKESGEHVRISALIVAGWWILFSLPLFMLVPDQPSRHLPLRQAALQGVRTLLHTLRNIRHYSNVARFLVARMIYNDGLNTLFAFGAIYAAGTFGMQFEEILLFGIVLNISAGIGAFAFGLIDERLGSKRIIMLSLVALIIIGILLILTTSVAFFWVLGVAIGCFFGPVQSASRALMAQIAPPGLEARMFGLYSLSGKAIAFVGPAVLGLVTDVFESQRAGMATIAVFFLIGLVVLAGVRDPRRAALEK
ncbi:MFS transporter [Fodinicurvata fenggangensis]|uniref:MFS transporter n=1 Tax=Fodinicurvata fenggangensis TaxID=1121830 RepID=UPI0009DE945D|nr:MFS transporter [Fodinicurvata fenggangensis]